VSAQNQQRISGNDASRASCQFLYCINDARISIRGDYLQQLKDDGATEY